MPHGMINTTFLAATLALLSLPSLATETRAPTLPALKSDAGEGDASTLIAALRQGGHVIYFRHTAATVGSDRPVITVGDCTTQRMMSPLGVSEAETLGEAFRVLAIPVETPVLSSEFCRSRETANIMFGEAAVTYEGALTGFPYMDYQNLTDAERLTRRGAIEAIFERPAPAGNRVMIAHGFHAGDGFGSIPNGGAVVLRPLGEGRGYDVVGRLTVEQWRVAASLPAITN